MSLFEAFLVVAGIVVYCALMFWCIGAWMDDWGVISRVLSTLVFLCANVLGVWFLANHVGDDCGPGTHLETVSVKPLIQECYPN